jgi:hypothetical protein
MMLDAVRISVVLPIKPRWNERKKYFFSAHLFQILGGESIHQRYGQLITPGYEIFDETLTLPTKIWLKYWTDRTEQMLELYESHGLTEHEREALMQLILKQYTPGKPPIIPEALLLEKRETVTI